MHPLGGLPSKATHDNSMKLEHPQGKSVTLRNFPDSTLDSLYFVYYTSSGEREIVPCKAVTFWPSGDRGLTCPHAQESGHNVGKTGLKGLPINLLPEALGERRKQLSLVNDVCWSSAGNDAVVA